MNIATDRELILCAQDGDVNAFEELVQRYDRRVLSLAFSYTRNSDDAKDIYQETLIRAYRSIRQFELRSEFSTWLYRIATNVCIRFKSTQRRYMDVFRGGERGCNDDGGCAHSLDLSSSHTTEGEFFRAELGRQIERALCRLSPMQRFVFTMKHYEGYKLREIAAMAEYSEGNVKKHLYEAVRRLQKELEIAL
jgi:RNA polymerase sigma-70 factor (ECF subfamily)